MERRQRLEADALALAEKALGLTFTSVRHAERCVFGAGDACSRRYDPAPYAEAEPVDLKMYAGTAIGALYGIGPATVIRTWLDDEGNTVSVEHELVQLEGWTLAPHSTHG